MARSKSLSYFVDRSRKFFSAASIVILNSNSGLVGLGDTVEIARSISSIRFWGHSPEWEIDMSVWVGFIAELADAWVDVGGSRLSLILGTGEVKVDEGEGCNLPKISKWLEVVTLEDLCDDINACIPPLPSVSFDNWTTSSSPSCIPGLEAL